MKYTTSDQTTELPRMRLAHE